MDISSFLDSVLFLDVETNAAGVIHGIGAVYGNRNPLRANNIQAVKDALPQLKTWADEAKCVCGHNSLLHDFPLLERTSFGIIADKKKLDTLLLSPLAFPKKPYHALIKDGKLASMSRNDPVADSQCCRKVLNDSIQELLKSNNEQLWFYEQAFESAGQRGTARLLRAVAQTVAEETSPELVRERKPDYKSNDGFLGLFKALNKGRCCHEKLPAIEEPDDYLVYAYIHAWLNVSGSDSVLPYWLCHRFPQIRASLHQMRVSRCGVDHCTYCNHMHSPTKSLQRFFGFESFRPIPANPENPNESLQERIVTTAFEGKSSLSILPTGGGKSICFQIPALHRYECTGALSIVVSPLQSLMKDQVENLRNRVGILHCNALYGLLTPLERKDCLDDIKMGSAGIIYVAPEQLRSVAFRRAILNREIAYWIYDEAHCLSKWGHDFRPDYLYAAKFIRELAQEQGVDPPQVMALTATAKQDVKDDIRTHFKNELGTDLILHDGGTDRSNLNYTVEKVSQPAKLERIVEILSGYYGEEPSYAGLGSVVIFAATRKTVEMIAGRLELKGWQAKAFHAGLEAEDKKQILEDFLTGTLKIIVSTNAFGMGVDKPDIRYVIHVDSPGSLENYLQEAGRAGRDGDEAECILLFDENDLETQHNFVAFSKITQKDIQIIWRAIRSAKSDQNGAIVLTVDEILSDKMAANISFDGERGANQKTKTQTAIALLERQGFLERKENRSRVFQASALVKGISEARAKIQSLNLPDTQQKLWVAVMKQFFEMPENKCSDITDFTQIEEMQIEFERAKKRDRRISSVNTVVFKVLNEMAKPTIALLKKDLLFTAFLKSGNRGATSSKKLNLLTQLETEFLNLLQTEEPDPDGMCVLSLRLVNETLSREGLLSHVETLGRTVKYLRDDWTKLTDGVPQLEISQYSTDRMKLQLRCQWAEVQRLAALRRDLAALILDLLQSKAPNKSDVVVSFSESELIEHIVNDLTRLDSQVKSLPAAIHHALLWLHDGKVIELQQGKSLITSAMTLYLKDHQKGGRARLFNQGDYAPLATYYVEKVLQIHVIGEYASKGIHEIGTHLHFIKEYFRMSGDRFIKKFFAGNKAQLKIATGIESYKKIYEELGNPRQQAIVGADEFKNTLILAGPGSGKTRAIVHRCAWLLRVDRVRAQGVIILCFNRFASLEIRRRLWALVGKDASAVTIQTFHGLALRILGRTMADIETSDGQGKLTFEQLIPEANRMLRSDEVPIGMDADEFRNRLVGSLSHILVDEYQDIGPDAYELVSLIAGKASKSDEDKLTIMAVGDDDQSIYGFAGANIEFIRRYETDYANSVRGNKDKTYMQRHYLVENYRSTENIIDATNRLIANNKDRMKIEYPIVRNKDRKRDSPGGSLQTLDPVSEGKVQVLNVADLAVQAEACEAEIQRLKKLDAGTKWSEFCVFARTNRELDIVRLVLEDAGIPLVVLGAEAMPNLRRVRIVHQWLVYLQGHASECWSGDELKQQLETYLGSAPKNELYAQMLRTIASVFYGDTGGTEQQVADIQFFFVEICSEKRISSNIDAVRLSTAHKAKGLEFDYVFVLDGQWKTESPSIRDLEEERRVFYVAITRARKLLSVFKLAGTDNRFIGELSGPDTLERTIAATSSASDKLGVEISLISLSDLWIDFAATLSDNDARLEAIQQIRSGDSLQLHSPSAANGTPRLELQTTDGTTVARLSGHGSKVWIDRRDRIIAIRVVGVHIRNATDGDQSYEGRNLKRDQWPVPICEVYWRRTT